MRRPTVMLLIALLAVLVAAPASAAPPERRATPWAITAPDFEHGFVIFLNTSREEFCTQDRLEIEQAIITWLEGGMQDPFPDVDLSVPETGFVAIPHLWVDTPKGVIPPTHASGLHIELWTLDDPANDPGVGACTATDDEGELFATGTSTFHGITNDFGQEGLRPTAVDHIQYRAEVTGVDGTEYRYTWFLHQHLPCVDGPGPRCEVTRSDLRPLR